MQQKNQYYYLVISLLFFSSCLCIQNLFAANIEINQSADPIQVYSDQPEFEIILKSNPTTGYKWYLSDINEALMSLLRSKEEDDNNKVSYIIAYLGAVNKLYSNQNLNQEEVPLF